MSGRGTGAGKWLWAAAICGGLGVFEATQTVLVMRAEGMHHAWTELFFAVLLSWLPWASAVPVILRYGAKYPLGSKSAARTNWLQHIWLWVLVVLAAAAWDAGLERWLNPWTPQIAPARFLPLWQRKFEGGLLSGLILYGGILLVGWMMESRERLARQQTEAARLNEQLAKAQLGALRQQIEPHFLFNTLNTIAGLVRERRNDGAVEMISRLSDLLRKTLRTTDQQVTLEEELSLVRKYLEIEQVRFGERLEARLEVPDELGKVRVPSLILQPLVENAVKHGIAKRVQGGMIAIAASRVNGMLRVSIRNDGPGFATGEGDGIGLKNVRERLKSLYGQRGWLEVKSAAQVEVTLVIPDEVKETKEVQDVKEKQELRA